MKVQEIDKQHNVNVLISRAEVSTFLNAVLTVLNFDEDHRFFSETGLFEEDLDFLRAKIRDSFSFFPDRRDGRGRILEGVSQNPKIGIWLNEHDVKILVDSLHFADKDIENWEEDALEGSDRETGQELYRQFKQLI